MSAQHTPGPWRLGKPSDTVVADHASGHDDPGSIEYYGGNLVAESIQPSNRHLIAAAPDLLVAAKAVERFIAGFEGDELQEGIDELLSGLRVAIAKATGEQPDEERYVEGLQR